MLDVRHTGPRPSSRTSESLKRRTADRYGFLWKQSDPTAQPDEYHYDRVACFLPTGHLRGRVLDAGCGDGIDTFRLARADGVEITAIDLTEEGLGRARRRTEGRTNVRFVQGDLEHLPLREGTFDFVYAYGVLHHLPRPGDGFRELVRVLKPGGMLAIYVYENFGTRTSLERLLLWLIGGFRHVTVRLPPMWLYQLCRIASPLVFCALTLPARLLARAPLTRRLSRRIPYHHGTGPFGLGGDLYDRFAAPIEYRYSRAEVAGWFLAAALTQVSVRPMRGWVGYGVKPPG